MSAYMMREITRFARKVALITAAQVQRCSRIPQGQGSRGELGLGKGPRDQEKVNRTRD